MCQGTTSSCPHESVSAGTCPLGILHVVLYCRSTVVPKGKAGTPHQTYIGHSAAVNAAVQIGDTLVTADAADCILFWKCDSRTVTAIQPSTMDVDASQENISMNVHPLQSTPEPGVPLCPLVHASFQHRMNLILLRPAKHRSQLMCSATRASYSHSHRCTRGASLQPRCSRALRHHAGGA